MRCGILLAAAVLAIGCKARTKSNPKGSAEPQTVLAQVDDRTITEADLKDLLARYANQPFVLARYSSIEKKKELLDSLIRYHVLAIEARKRGYERDPEVQRVAKDKMVRLFTQQEIDDKVNVSDVSEAEVRRFYEDHAAEYVRPETVRVSQILIKDRAKAQRALVAAKTLPRTDLKAFRDLVARESEDADSKQRGGDLTQFDRATTQHPPAVVAAAFALKEVGALSDLVAIDKGYAILKLTERRPAVSRTFEEVRPEIRKRLLDRLRATKKKELLEEARKSVKVEIFEDQLVKLDLATGLARPDPSRSPAQRPSLDAGAVVGNQP
jgi:peptidyl-prolyl cis-trans isomerase C